MTTVRNIIEDSLMEIGVLAEGETSSAAQAQSAFRHLNRMLGTWSNQPSMGLSQARYEGSLIAGQQTYTIGPGGTFNTARPVHISGGGLKVLSQSPPLEIPLRVLTAEQWAGVGLKTMTQPYPEAIIPFGASPITNISIASNTLASVLVWPIPTEVNTLVIYAWTRITPFATIDDTVALSPGYEDALMCNLAVRLAPGYGAQVRAETLGLAVNALEWIKSANVQPVYLKSDPALLAPSGWVDWRTGE